MQTNIRLTTKPTHEVIAAINALDLTSVKVRLMDVELGEGWTQEYADSIEAAYKNFLVMVAKHQDEAEDIMLAKDVDEFWHTHILQTLKYTADCQAVFGTYLHHAPHVGKVTQEDLARRTALADKTRRLYEQEFGSGVNLAWGGAVPAAQRAAFSGAAVTRDAAAFSGVAVREKNAAFSGIGVKADRAAFSGVAIKEQSAAFSGVAVNADQAAFSGVAVKAEGAAFSGVAIKEQNAAFSGVAVNAERAAFSGVAIKERNAAFSGVAVDAKNAAFSGVAVKAQNAAFSGVAVKTAGGSVTPTKQAER